MIGVIDQYPEVWGPQMVAAMKCLIVFQLGPNQGNKVNEYDAPNLPDTGMFYFRHMKYNTWQVHDKLTKLLMNVPALSVNPRVIDRAVQHVQYEQPSEPFNRSPTDVDAPPVTIDVVSEQRLAAQADAQTATQPGPTELQEIVWQWRDTFPKGRRHNCVRRSRKQASKSHAATSSTAITIGRRSVWRSSTAVS